MTRNLAPLTEAQILALQGHAVATSDSPLLALTYTALGRSSRYFFAPVTVGEQRQAVEGCAVAMETLRVTGERLRVVTP